MFEIENPNTLDINILVIGVGGGGCNAVRAMAKDAHPSVRFLLLDSNILSRREDPLTAIQIGAHLTKGLGTGGNVAQGKEIAGTSLDLIAPHLENVSMVFVATTLGGGFGTGAAPSIAKLSREKGILTVGLAALPFPREGRKRMKTALEGLNQFSQNVDSMIVISNEKMLQTAKGKVGILEGFRPGNEMLAQAVCGIVDVIFTEGLINLDFADIRTVMGHQGAVIMGKGRAHSEKQHTERVINAIKSATESPLLYQRDISEGKRVLVNIVGPPDMTMEEFHGAMDYLGSKVGEEAEIIAGLGIDESAQGTVLVTVLVSGLPLKIDEMK